MDTAFIELMPWARLTVEHCVGMRPGEEALILTDTRAQEYRGASAFIQALMAAIHAHGCRANLITYTPLGSPVVEPPRLVAQAMRSADVLFTLPTVPLTETEAMRIALAEGARALLFGGAAGAGRDDDMLYRLAPTSVEELTRVGGLSTAMTRSFKTGKRVRLTSRRGTDLTLTVGDLDIINMDGRCTEPGMMQFYVPGLVNAGVTPGSVNGRVVFDTSLAPLTGSLPEAVTMTIEDGFVTSVEGGPAAAAWRAMAEGFGDPNVFHVLLIHQPN